MAVDDIFKEQAQLLVTLPHKERSGDDLFKDQTDLFSQLPHKEKSATNVQGNPLFQGMGSRIFVVSLFFFLIVTLITVGAISIVLVEDDPDQFYTRPFPDCFDAVVQKSSNNSNMTIEDALNMASFCIKKAQSVDEYKHGILFTWSLAGTVGYGHRFPHSRCGQVMCVAYAWLFIPVYMALKTEFGEILAILILFTGQKMKQCMMRFGPSWLKITLERRMSHPSDLILAVILFVLFAAFVSIVSTIVMFTNKIIFWEALYLTMITVLQVGLGDMTPIEEWYTFVFVIPMFLFGDALASYLNYYIHGIYRLKTHKLALLLCCSKKNTDEDGGTNEGAPRLGIVKSICDFPVITNTMMPLRATTAEVEYIPPQLSPLTPLETPPVSTKQRKNPSPMIEVYTPVYTPVVHTAMSPLATERTQNSCRTSKTTMKQPRSRVDKKKSEITKRRLSERTKRAKGHNAITEMMNKSEINEKRARETVNTARTVTRTQSNLTTKTMQEPKTPKVQTAREKRKMTILEPKDSRESMNTERGKLEKSRSTENFVSEDTKGEKEVQKEAASEAENTAVSKTKKD